MKITKNQMIYSQDKLYFHKNQAKTRDNIIELRISNGVKSCGRIISIIV